ncbi:DUF1801 domain-containing protein [Pseudoalteromonas sp. H105]|jgi:hypothetical protein|uniref:DUF1801 domain-containing protein n=1 Tax=Pseudoalteromonas sp. H105 TaxID=1348393 RepID=UPI00073211BA|nr:DUF1801 domain-containing protein [Pseudoalteromonas sp. H105]KTF17952.1 hypothetical protein ATS75_00615 [Pseudoalteromonas sp. H105]
MTIKTQANQITLQDCLTHIDPKRLDDANTLIALFEKITQEPAVVWGKDMIGFGCYQYKYDSGQSGEWPLTGFSPRKTKLSLYIMSGFENKEITTLLKQLGKHSVSKSCLYISKLDKIDLSVLELIITLSVKLMKAKYPAQ